ncbi:MAG: phosphatidate cytidylyltransferase, partial [Clostridia bacterium]|nr:phosphatidate cytidylyltransferase [Clostridia bacterium]
MKKRIITGAVYVVVFFALVALKWCVPGGWGSLGFDALFCAVAVIGCLEFLKAMGGVSYLQKVITVAFCAVAVPLYVAVQMAMGQGFLALACCACIYAFALAALNVFHHGVSTVKGTAICLFAMLYCGVLSTILSAVNHVENNSTAAILLMFFTVMFADSGAYIIGSLLSKKIPLKLAPRLSPNKTVIGGVGGIVGGMLGSIIAYYIYFG